MAAVGPTLLGGAGNGTKDILKRNSNLNFVKRILDAKNSPMIKNPDGSVSTHLMAAETVDFPDGSLRHIVFPTITQEKDKGLKKRELRDAIKTAIERREYIEFNDLQTAIKFSTDYKAGMNMGRR